MSKKLVVERDSIEQSNQDPLVCPHLLSVLQSECEQSLARSLYLNKPTLQCVWSGKSINKKTLDVDHALPFSVCRNNDLWNLLPANRTLNQKQKRDLIPSPGFIMRQQDKIIDNWQFIHGSEPELFDFEVARAIGESLSSGWEDKLLAHLKLGAEKAIYGRGCKPWVHG